jgi:recombination protein RecA
MPVDTTQYDAVVSAINKKYNDKIKKGDQIANPERISTGSLELDLAMGGGLPLGRRTRLAGPYSSGKSLICWNVIRNAQAMGLKCVYYNVEKQFTPEYVESKGVDISQLEIVDETTIEGIGEILESLLGVAHLHVIDSTKAAVSLDALNCSISDWRPGLEARAWGKVFNVMNERFDYEANTLIQVDQVRVKNFQGGGEEPAGGKVFDHASDMTVIFRKGTYLYYDADGFLSEAGKDASKNTITKQHIPAGRLIQARVDKSRVSRPLLPATMMLDLNNNNFDHIFELSKAAKEHGVVEVKAGGNYYYRGMRLYGEAKLRDFIRGDVTVQEEIRQTALAHTIGKKALVTDEDLQAQLAEKGNPFLARRAAQLEDEKKPAKKKAPAKKRAAAKKAA